MKLWAWERREMMIAAFITLAGSVAAIQLELHERWHQISRIGQDWNMAELSGVLAALLLASTWYFWSCARHWRREARRRELAAETVGGAGSRLREFLDGVSDLFQSVAPDGTLIYANRAWRETLGYSEKDLAGAKIFDFIHPDSRDHCRTVFDDIMAGEGEREFEATFRSKDGEPVMISGSARRRTEQGEPVATEALFHNVTARRKSEQELRQSRHLLETIFQLIPASIFVKDKNGRYLMANESFSRSLDETPKSIVGHTFTEIGYGSDKERALTVAQDVEVLESGRRIESLELPLTHADGIREWRHVIKVPLRDDSGNITGLVGLSDDVTDLKNARDALRASEKRFRQFAEASSDWFWEMDADLRFTWFSDRVEEVTGVPAAFHIGKTRQELAGDIDDVEKWEQHFEDLKARRQFRNFAYWRTGPDGHRQYVTGSGVPFNDEEGNFLGYRGTGSDITEQKLNEDAIHALNIELEQRVSERTEESQQANEKLAAALTSMSDGFVLYDADERLVVCNPKYHEIYRESADLMRPGRKFEDIIRDVYNKGTILDNTDGVEEWVRDRMERFRNPGQPYEYQMSDGRWLLIEEYRTPDGGVVGIRKDITERKLAEETLRFSEERHAGIVNTAVDAIITVGEDQRIQLFNQGAERIFGYAAEEMIGQPLELLIPSQFRPAHSDLVKSFGDGAENARAINARDGVMGLRKNGEAFPAEASISQLDVRGVKAYTVSLRDVTARKQAEEKLRDSQRLLQTVFDSFPHHLYVKDTSGKFLMMNETVAKLMGWQTDDSSGKSSDDLSALTPETREQFKAEDNRVLQSGKSLEISKKTITYVDGHEEFRRVIKMPLLGDDGAVVGVVGINEDITERILAEDRVTASERLLRAVIDSLPYWISVKDSRGVFQIVNQSLAEAHNWTVEQFIGKNTGDTPRLIDKDELIRMRHLNEEVLSSGEPREIEEYEVRSPGGESRLRKIEKYPLFDENGRAISVISWSEDITGRKEAEDRMKLQQMQLIHADKMASLGVLVAGVAHEINNPNTAIMLNVPLLGQMWEAALPALEHYHGEHPDFMIANLPFERARNEIPKLLSGIIRGSNRVNHIVNNLKNFGRINEGQAAAMININDVVELAISLLKSHINQFTDNFSVEYGDDIPQFKGHFHEIEQVVINLVNNACQALADRKQKVRVSTGYNPEGRVIEVEVRDEGSGIPEDILNKIMDPFFTTRAETGGTGLGLSVSFGILQEHGGGLSFDSKVGVGTSATVTLPSA